MRSDPDILFLHLFSSRRLPPQRHDQRVSGVNLQLADSLQLACSIIINHYLLHKCHHHIMSEEISKGSIVVVESRTWPGSNKPGGVARVTAVHDADNDDGTANANTTTSPKKKKKRYDVSYVLGGKEKGVDEEHVTLQSSLSGGDDDKKKRSSGGGDLRISTSTASLPACP